MRWITLFSIILLLPLALAQPPFGDVEISGISPPSIPESLGPAVTFVFYDTNGTRLSDAHISFVATKDETQIVNTLFYSRDGSISVNLPREDVKITAAADLLSTDGFDGYGAAELVAREGLIENVTLFPVGSVRGIAYAGDAVAEGAIVRAECQGRYGMAKEARTDSLGTFSFDFLPIGNCRISARRGSALAFSTVIVQKGSLSDLELKLHSPWSWIPYAVGALIAAIGWALFLLASRRKKERPTERPSVADDILKTLRPPEQEVVRFLLPLGDSTMAAIYHKTAIPKTSLVRILETLEAKQIIETKKLGKMRKVKLTPWFIEKCNKKTV